LEGMLMEKADFRLIAWWPTVKDCVPTEERPDGSLHAQLSLEDLIELSQGCDLMIRQAVIKGEQFLTLSLDKRGGRFTQR